ncbi:primosomal protein N' (replication factor Y) [Elusimicrobium simillimum]|uniref:replication restart helicase PriA n=1 Tax=Elusimicrobium simillimum TaxID=3143438 RepID=UPI003C6FC2D4
MYCKVVFDIALDREFDYIVPDALADAARPGVRVKAPFGPRVAVGIITSVAESVETTFKLKEIKEVLDITPPFSSDLLDLALYMKATWGGGLGPILFSLVPFFVREAHKAQFAPHQITTPNLTAQQEAAVSDINASSSPCLLYGPGSSGKKDILVSLAAEAAQNGPALILLPDILSCEVFAEYIKKFIPNNVHVWHSKILLSAKKTVFASLLQGDNCVVIGTRSAALLPFVKPTFFAVINEESEDYKQEENRPFYHVRDILLHRVKANGGKLVFSSQTPSLEILKMAAEGGVKQITLSQNLNIENPFPMVSVTGKKAGKQSVFPDVTFDQLTLAVKSNETTLLVLNSRGGAPVYSCLNCGLIARCPDCNGILVFKNETDTHLTCLKCGKTAQLEQKCPKCENVIFRMKTSGTQKTYTEVKKLFPAANIIRMDTTLAAPQIAEGKANIIIATTAGLKMLAESKASVNLVVFLDADMELNSPDFRASEHLAETLFTAKSMLHYTAGARMVVTTDKAESGLINAVVHGDYNAFAAEEAEFREAFNFPPYATLIRINISAKDKALLLKRAEDIKQAFAPLGDVLGPITFGKKTDALKKEYLLLKNIPFAAVTQTMAALPADKNIKIKVVVDPYSFF